MASLAPPSEDGIVVGFRHVHLCVVHIEQSYLNSDARDAESLESLKKQERVARPPKHIMPYMRRVLLRTTSQLMECRRAQTRQISRKCSARSRTARLYSSSPLSSTFSLPAQEQMESDEVDDSSEKVRGQACQAP